MENFVVFVLMFVNLYLITAANDFDAGNFLEKFGYLDDLAPGQAGHAEASTNAAITGRRAPNEEAIAERLFRLSRRKRIKSS